MSILLSSSIIVMNDSKLERYSNKELLQNISNDSVMKIVFPNIRMAKIINTTINISDDIEQIILNKKHYRIVIFDKKGTKYSNKFQMING